MKPIVIAADHAGFEMKAFLIKTLSSDYTFIDCGTFSPESVDYPDYAAKGTEKIKNKEADFGILICGTGIGMSIAANRYPFVRAALCRTPEEAELARLHNDANVLCLGARISTLETAQKITKTFLTTSFSNEKRHLQRIQKLSAC